MAFKVVRLLVSCVVLGIGVAMLLITALGSDGCSVVAIEKTSDLAGAGSLAPISTTDGRIPGQASTPETAFGGRMAHRMVDVIAVPVARTAVASAVGR